MNVIKYLKDYNVSFDLKNDGKLEVHCPFHEDTHPSGVFDSGTGHYKCWACKKSTNIYGYLAQRLGKTLKEVYNTINKRYSDNKDTICDPQDIERWHGKLWEHETFLKELKDRQVDGDLIRQYRLGVYGGNSISIPIQNASGNFIKIRIYKPGSVKRKFTQLKNATKLTGLLFPIEQLAYDEILICGGEIKAIVAAKELNKHDIGAISGLTGENSWEDSLTSFFDGKTVYVCYDVDEIGELGAEEVCKKLQNVVEWIGKFSLPTDILDREKYPKGDINDFIREGGELYPLIKECEKWVRVDNKKLDEKDPCVHVNLDQAVGAEYAGKRIAFEAVVSSIDTRPYSIPNVVEIKCPRGLDFCSNCAVSSMAKTEQKYELQSERIELMEIVGEERKSLKRILKGAIGIPNLCQECEFVDISSYNVEDVRISEQLDIKSQKVERTMQIAYCVGAEGLELNTDYHMEGRMYPHPKNQQASLLISSYKRTKDALDTYTPENLDKLTIFQPDEWTTQNIQERLDSIYEDFEANVTYIYKRRSLHLAIDLSYHSPLFIPINNISTNGWAEVLIVGDSAQGKTKASSRLLQHYGLGERVICKGATRAGLLGGSAQQGNKRWFVTWGKIPINDRRLVILEELKGASVEVIAALTDMRSSGTAEITQIEARRAKARTRLIGISNPRSINPLSSYNFGVDAIKELIGSPEDVRRWDLCLLLDRREVDGDEVLVLEKNPPIKDHVYTSELCRELVLWGWTLRNIEFENQGTLFDVSSELCKEYSDVIPIVDRFSMKEKLAKLSAALAVRTFSCDNEALIIRDCHIRFIADFLKDTYSSEYFGYRKYSKAIFEAENLISEPAIIQRIQNKLNFPEEFVQHSLTTELMNTQWIQDLLGYDQDTARNLLSFLIRQRAVKPTDKRGMYRKTVSYTDLLRKLATNGELKIEKPDYVEDKEEF